MRILAGGFIGDQVNKAINDCIKGVVTSVMDFAVGGTKAIVGQLSQSLPVIKTWYGIFLAFATSLVVAVVIGRIIATMLKETDESTDVTWENIVMDAVKSAIAIPIMIFAQGFLQAYITIPLAKSMFDMSGKYSADAISGTTKIYTGAGNTGSAIEIGAGMSLVFLIFFMIVTIAFLVKMSIFFAHMAWYTLSIPFAAIAIATENFDYGTTWWKKLVYYNVSMLSQILSLTLCIYCLTHLSSLGFVGLMGSIGFGWLVLHTPHVIQDFWSSTGITKGAGRVSIRGLTNLIRSKAS